MPEHVEKLLDEWSDAQFEPSATVEMPQELKGYHGHDERVIEKVEANGCMIN